MHRSIPDQRGADIQEEGWTSKHPSRARALAPFFNFDGLKKTSIRQSTEQKSVHCPPGSRCVQKKPCGGGWRQPAVDEDAGCAQAAAGDAAGENPSRPPPRPLLLLRLLLPPLLPATINRLRLRHLVQGSEWTWPAAAVHSSPGLNEAALTLRIPALAGPIVSSSAGSHVRITLREYRELLDHINRIFIRQMLFCCCFFPLLEVSPLFGTVSTYLIPDSFLN